MSKSSLEILSKIEPIFTTIPARKVGRDWWASKEKRLLEKNIAWATVFFTPYVPALLIAMGAARALEGSPVIEKIPMHHPYYGNYHKVKIRSMIVGAYEQEPSLVKRHQGLDRLKDGNDPRITPLGKVLRRVSADELPQIWSNVINGHTALVGPREFGINEYTQIIYPKRNRNPYKEYLHNLETGMRTGITGLGPVLNRHLRPRDKVMVENYWAENCTMYSDLAILLLTATPHVFLNGQ